ncbi:unnamed protein product [Larinioides sclopetarius]|uniref:Uncharacterized protein n=1 Tax=Larinioides sclopetarius TaxID=280406 RepID=A0AAV2BL50_9ARAC
MTLWAIPSSSDTSSWVRPHSSRPIILPRKKSSKCFLCAFENIGEFATENLKCLNETFSKTRCNGEAEDIVEPLIKEVNENVGSRPNLSIFCLRSMLVSGCALRAISDNCGQLVGAAALDALRRSKSIENDCSVRGAQSVLDELDNLDLSEVQKRSLDQLLGKFVEENSE